MAMQLQCRLPPRHVFEHAVAGVPSSRRHGQASDGGRGQARTSTPEKFAWKLAESNPPLSAVTGSWGVQEQNSTIMLRGLGGLKNKTAPFCYKVLGETHKKQGFPPSLLGSQASPSQPPLSKPR